MSPSLVLPGVLVWTLRPRRGDTAGWSYFNGREARQASWGWNLFKTLAQTVVFWALFLFLLPAGLYGVEQVLGLESWRFTCPAGVLGGILLFVLGGSLGMTSGVVMAIQGGGTPLPADCARELVVAGPYRYIRNPMAVAGLAQGVAVGIFLGSPAVVIYALVGGPVWHVFVRPWEEADLERRFGDPYRRYCAAVRCWLPRFPGYQPAAKTPNQALV
jgi:protein-S-isoprenylcysteine O-methyltransferase Ste14